jgi:DDE superfamily endonuclease
MDIDEIIRHASIATAMYQQYQTVLDKQDKDETDAIAICVLSDERLSKIRKRMPKKFYERLDWEQAEDGFTDTQFSTRYRMSKATFHRLLNLIRPKLVVDEKQSRNSTSGGNVIRPEHCLHCLLRYLAGGSYLDACDICKISESSYIRVIWKTLNAINTCPELQMNLPTLPSSDPDRINEIKETFCKSSTSPAFQNCVGAIDGWLAVIRTPSPTEEANVNAFYSGHYKAMGLNVQAMVDGNCMFLYASILCPGSTNDVIAYRQTPLCRDFVPDLPIGSFIVGDNAYPLGTRLLVPFNKVELKSVTGEEREYHETFNFYLSQIRIRVEMAFGMLVNKWAIFQRPLHHNTTKASAIIQCAMLLHNLCIKARLELADTDDIDLAPEDAIDANNPFGLSDTYLDYSPSTTHSLPPRRGDPLTDSSNITRQEILAFIRERKFTRPSYNIERNRKRARADQSDDETDDD